MSFDISSLDEYSRSKETGAELRLNHPATGEPTDIVVIVAHHESKRVRDAVLAHADRVLAEQRKGRSKNARAIYDTSLYQDAALVVSWDGITAAGEPYPCTIENVSRLFSQHPELRQQVREFASDNAAFFRGAD